MNGETEILIAGVLVTLGLLMLALSVLWRGKQAETAQDDAERRARADAAIRQRAMEEVVQQQAHLLREEVIGWFQEVDRRLAVLEQPMAASYPAPQEQPAAPMEQDALAPAHPLPPPAAAPPDERLSDPQMQALAHVYWEMEALAAALRRNIAALPAVYQVKLPAAAAQAARTIPILPAEPMREAVAVLGHEVTKAFDAITAGLDHLHTDTTPATAGDLRRSLTLLSDQVGRLLVRLEEVTASAA